MPKANIHIRPVGYVHSQRKDLADDGWGDETSTILLMDEYTDEALWGLDAFSHVEVLFWFHQVPTSKVVTGRRHPRGNVSWPSVGIFAQRGKNRPNRLGATICSVLRVEGTRLFVSGLDAIDGTPVLDIKPVMAEFLPPKEVRQPQWSHELMAAYWHK